MNRIRPISLSVIKRESTAAMHQEVTTIKIKTNGKGLYDFTAEVQTWMRQTGIQTGLLTAFCRHTSASMTIQENADPDVVRDLNDYFCTIAPEDPNRYRHSSEGADDMPAHIKSALTDVSLSIPVVGGCAALGTWQGMYLFEHRTRGQQREVILQVMGR